MLDIGNPVGQIETYFESTDWEMNTDLTASFNPESIVMGTTRSGVTPGLLTMPTLVVDPITANLQSVAFTVAGLCDIAVDVTVEWSTTQDFDPGTGNATCTTTEDGYSTGAFNVPVPGLKENVTYYYRVNMSNGADNLWYPAFSGAGSTVAVTILPKGTAYGNDNALIPARSKPGTTPQNYFLYILYVTYGGIETYPLAVIDTSPSAFGGFSGANLRRKDTGKYYVQQDGDTWHFRVYGMWDDGNGTMELWSNTTYDRVIPSHPVPGNTIYGEGPGLILYTTKDVPEFSTLLAPVLITVLIPLLARKRRSRGRDR